VIYRNIIIIIAIYENKNKRWIELNAIIKSDGNCKTLFIIGNAEYYYKTFSRDLNKYFQIVYIDHRGFCEQEDSNECEFTIEKIINDIENVRDKLKLNKVILIGHSIHAFMAVEYVKRYENNIDALVLIATSPIVGNEVYKEANQHFQKTASEERKGQLMINFSNNFHHNAIINRMLQFGPMLWYDFSYNAQHLWQNVQINDIGMSKIYGDMFANCNIAEDLKNTNLKTILILGKYDYFNPISLWDECIKSKPQNLRIFVFEKSGHNPQLEESELFNKVLISNL
jgi:proline iminopeptidase